MAGQKSIDISNHNSHCLQFVTTSEEIPGIDLSEPGKYPEKQQTVYLGLVKGENYGWGVCSRYLIETMSKDVDIHVLLEEDGSAQCDRLKGPLFQGLSNHEFTPLFPQASGTRDFAYTFFENELTQNSIENAKRFELVFGGSSWCRDRMLEKGIDNCSVLIQGIDPRIFHPIRETKPQDRFVLFSGGKFELRKGQDLLLRALKILQEKYSDIWLVNCWYNLWPASTRLMEYSRHIQFKYRENETWRDSMQRTYVMNGLDPERIITHELVPHDQQRALFTQTDIGVFPNRCEGGTNLVMMEYMACAKPVIASNTSGHKDILTEHNALRLDSLSGFNVNDAHGQIIARWQEPSVDELVARIEYAYHHRDDIRDIGQRAGEDLKQFTWEHTAGCLKQVMGI
jgi:glycosyltransferase involved in cell wall biosynthesis